MSNDTGLRAGRLQDTWRRHALVPCECTALSPTRFRPPDENLHGFANLIRHARFRRNEFRGKPGEQSDQVVRHQDLPVAVGARPYPNRRDLQRGGDLPRCLKAHDSEYHGEHACFLDGLGSPAVTAVNK